MSMAELWNRRAVADVEECRVGILLFCMPLTGFNRPGGRKGKCMGRLLAVASVVAVVSIFGVVPNCRAQASLAGDWEGILNADGHEVHVAWHVTAAADGTVTSTIENHDEGVSGIKVKQAELKDSKITFTVDDQIEVNGETLNVRGTFEGTVSADGNEITGTWTQTEPQEQPQAEIHFKRVTPAASPEASPAASPAASPSGNPAARAA